MKHGKKYVDSLKLIDKSKNYEASEAIRRERKRRERAIRELIRELPAMLVIGAGMFAWALLLWTVAP